MLPVLLVATRNHGKLVELEPMIAAAGYRPLSLDAAGIAEDPQEDALESFDTFAENALAKAQYFYARSDGIAVLADDSGLVVDALNGAPGVRSKRWSGSLASGAVLDAENNAKLLAVLLGQSNRQARFVCVAAIVSATGSRFARGENSGRILECASGTGGFGYDPLFWSDELGKTFADASLEEKSQVSHRARAVAAVLAATTAHESGVVIAVDRAGAGR